MPPHPRIKIVRSTVSMSRIAITVALILATASLGAAHKPPGPVNTCQPPTGESYHDYLPANGGGFVLAIDGNVENCGIETFPDEETCQEGPLEGFQKAKEREQKAKAKTGAALEEFKKKEEAAKKAVEEARKAAEELKKAVEEQEEAFKQMILELWRFVMRPFGCGGRAALDPSADFDGELDSGFGGVILAVNGQPGDTSGGAYVCHGMIGHHTGDIYAQEWPDGSGPALLVGADVGIADEACGDGLVNPCNPDPPAPAGEPFPANLVLDTLHGLVYALSESPGTTCTLGDCAEDAASDPSGPSHVAMSCPPGADGTYVVFVVPDPNAPDAPQGGHVWTL